MRTPIVQALLDKVGVASEAEIKQFVQDHWAEFPIMVQDQLAVAMMSDELFADLASKLDAQGE